MSDSHPEYRPYASGVGVFIGIVILWVCSYGVFALGKMVVASFAPGGEAGGG